MTQAKTLEITTDRDLAAACVPVPMPKVVCRATPQKDTKHDAESADVPNAAGERMITGQSVVKPTPRLAQHTIVIL